MHSGLLGREFSRMLHRAFDARQESDYKEFIVVGIADAVESVEQAEHFLRGVKALIGLIDYAQNTQLQDLAPRDHYDETQ